MYLYTLPGLPEQVDIGQAMALDFQAVGLKAKLTEIDFPRVRSASGPRRSTGSVPHSPRLAGPGYHSPGP